MAVVDELPGEIEEGNTERHRLVNPVGVKPHAVDGEDWTDGLFLEGGRPSLGDGRSS